MTMYSISSIVPEGNICIAIRSVSATKRSSAGHGRWPGAWAPKSQKCLTLLAPYVEHILPSWLTADHQPRDSHTPSHGQLATGGVRRVACWQGQEKSAEDHGHISHSGLRPPGAVLSALDGMFFIQTSAHGRWTI